MTVLSKKVVVAVFEDDAAARDALALGVALARALRGELVLAATWVEILGRGGVAYGRRERQEFQRELDRLRDLVPRDLDVRTSADGAASRLRCLHRLVADGEDDVLVLSATDLERHGRGNLALEMLHDASCAVAVAPAGFATVAPAPDVAVAWNDAAESRMALDAGVGIAQHTTGTLRLVQVVTEPYRLAEEPWVDASDTKHWLIPAREEAKASLARGVDRVAGRVPVTTELREGATGPELARAAVGCGVIVAGSRGYGSLRRLILGSTTEALLREATVPVLITPRSVAQRTQATDRAAPAWHT
jgi:nucleotide-binding universal stress UspA family protein